MEISKTAGLIIGILGVLFGISGLGVYLTRPESIIAYTTLEVLAAIHLIVFFMTHFEVLKDVSHQRSTQMGANAMLMAAIFVAIVSIINFIIAQHEVRFDLSGTEVYTLSPQTITIVKGLKQDVKISGFFQDGGNKIGAAKDLFENYRHQSSKVKYEFIDPDKKPAVAKQYGITEYDTVVIESMGQSSVVKNISEQELTSALIRLGRTTKKQFYFIEGHGEHSIDDADKTGYSHIKEVLEKQGFAVKKLILLSEKKVPADAEVVIMGGPTNPYAPEEQAVIDEYLSRGGKFFALLDPLSKNNIDGFFAKWGVILEKDIVVDPSSGLGPAIPIITPNGYLKHAITDKFNLATFYSLARSVSFDPNLADKFRFDSFLQTGPNSWGTTRIGNGEVSIDPALDKKGPIVIGGLFSPKGEAASKMQLVVIGDSDFAT
ncbi:MAG: GldG family protein, partial [Nitrospirae bacterium]|nr:GldG family protein [Candidatus Troglogloeales bacterium]